MRESNPLQADEQLHWGGRIIDRDTFQTHMGFPNLIQSDFASYLIRNHMVQHMSRHLGSGQWLAAAPKGERFAL
jgi:hypothetical protein